MQTSWLNSVNEHTGHHDAAATYLNTPTSLNTPTPRGPGARFAHALCIIPPATGRKNHGGPKNQGDASWLALLGGCPGGASHAALWLLQLPGDGGEGEGKWEGGEGREWEGREWVHVVVGDNACVASQQGVLC